MAAPLPPADRRRRAFRALMPGEPLYETPEANDFDAAAEAAQVGAELAQSATGAPAALARPGEPA